MEIIRQFQLELEGFASDGGYVLWAMLGLSVFLYGILASTWFGLWKLKKEMPVLSATLEDCEKVGDVFRRVEIIELDQLAWVERRVPVIAVMIALAPLAGLLGTVSGMLSTFAGLASQAVEKPIDSISSGISEALVTTQAGLFMAIPAAFLFVLLKNRIEQSRGSLEEFAVQKVIRLKGGAA